MSSSLPLVARDLRFGYDQKKVFHFPPLTLYADHHCLVTGNSGSGKTTFIHLLCGLLKPWSGEIVLNGTTITQLSGRKMDRFRGQHIGLVFQKIHLIKSLTVLENLTLAQILAGVKPDPQHQKNVLKCLDMEEVANCYPKSLSQGQLQRVAIARSVVNKPKIIIADEPTSALDDTNAHKVLDLLLNQADQNKANLLIATHDQRIKNRIPNIYYL